MSDLTSGDRPEAERDETEPRTALDTVTELRAATFDLLDAATEREAQPGSPVSEAVDRLQVVANELGAVEELLRRAPILADRPARLRESRRRRR